jgi:hypothetical protein
VTATSLSALVICSVGLQSTHKEMAVRLFPSAELSSRADGCITALTESATPTTRRHYSHLVQSSDTMQCAGMLAEIKECSQHNSGMRNPKRLAEGVPSIQCAERVTLEGKSVSGL